jgi:hypothetical protein
MANENSNHQDTEHKKTEVFEPYKWGHAEVSERTVTIPGHVLSEMATKANEIGSGVSTILQLIEASELEEDNEPGIPLIHKGHAGALMSLAIRSLEMLADDAERTMAWAYEYRTPKGIKERERRHQ